MLNAVAGSGEWCSGVGARDFLPHAADTAGSHQMHGGGNAPGPRCLCSPPKQDYRAVRHSVVL